MRNDVLAPSELNNSPSNVQTRMSCGSAKPAVENMQTAKNNRPELEVPQAETELNIFGEPFNLNTLLRNGVIEELVKAVGDRGYKKSNSRKTKKTCNSASSRSRRKKQKTNRMPLNDKEPCLIQTDNLTSTVSNVAVVQQTVNASDIHIPISSGIRSHELSRVDESHSKTSVGNSAETVHVDEVAMGDDVYIGPDLYETPEIVALVDVQKHAGPSQSEDIDSVCNTLKIVDVFSTHDISSTSMPAEYVIDTLYSSDTSNWHSPSCAENQSNSLSSSACSMQSPSKNPSDIRNWHTVSSQSPLNTLPSYTPPPSRNPQNSSKKRGKVVDSGSTLNGSSPTEEEDEILVIEVVKANKDSIAKHWEKCPSGFTCKFCTKTYKRLIKCENHIRIHLGVKPYECHICKRRYHKKRLLNEHCSNHTGKKLYQCKECDKSFRYRKNFKTHAESHVAESSSSYTCEICGKTFSLQFGYWSHKTSKHVIVDTQTVGVD
ncbi:hypothetical protein B7P43_G01059 [Cryptotermes secundus]|nr:hypothetical protein B7P43_G01059 [Cryptotermes secundus]